ncbi:hypothetical protein BDZ94DRAFT_722923 [Collybia nuda]|uniref:Uncharacterized protein n=1 Tax=Collybia nuda TaxID=64659 RepID=A0A9P6CJ54_9AGAR|nr:hypothetical protein BDZ94DRAFT_722923 [Collybia nuda]
MIAYRPRGDLVSLNLLLPPLGPGSPSSLETIQCIIYKNVKWCRGLQKRPLSYCRCLLLQAGKCGRQIARSGVTNTGECSVS